VKKLNKEKYTWTKVLAPTLSKASDLVIRTDRTPDYLFATFPGLVYRSTNSDASGSTWSQVYSNPDPGRISLAIAPNNQDCVYGLSSRGDGQLQGVIKSTNGGTSWQTPVQGPYNPNNLNTFLLTNPKTTYCLGQPSHQGAYDNVIAVDPSNPNIVWAGGIEL
jgi:hypothetical protein